MKFFVVKILFFNKYNFQKSSVNNSGVPNPILPLYLNIALPVSSNCIWPKDVLKALESGHSVATTCHQRTTLTIPTYRILVNFGSFTDCENILAAK